MTARVDRRAALPDADFVAACRRDPERGPRILFFSGGSALRDLSRVLPEYTHNSIHLITPFDSGGSSAHLRRAFGMPSVGDVRNRLVALAPATSPRQSAVHRALSHRLPEQAHPEVLRQLLRDAAAGRGSLTSGVPEDVKAALCQHLGKLLARLPENFDPRGASVGNLVLVASFLEHGRDLDSAIEDLGRLLQVRGTVCPTAVEDAQLAARLADGTRIVGQHRLTGKETPPLTSAIDSIWLVMTDDATAAPARVSLSDRARRLIATAELICFPTGSFFSSVLANLLPTGVGKALVANPCPKVYVPNTGVDPEQKDLSLKQCVDKLVRTIRSDVGDAVPIEQILDVVLVDRTDGHYTMPMDKARVEEVGVAVRTMDLVSADAPQLDARRLAETLVSISGRAPGR